MGSRQQVCKRFILRTRLLGSWGKNGSCAIRERHPCVKYKPPRFALQLCAVSELMAGSRAEHGRF
jgi:hypothetical protein